MSMRGIILRLETVDGAVKWRLFENAQYATDHATLCRAFNLDPIRTSFDLPSTARGIGSASGDHARGPRLINGLVFWPAENARSEKDRIPIGKLTFLREG